MKNKIKKFLKLPEYPGGNEAFKKYIKDNLVYPKEALQRQIEGTVYLKVEINDNGEVLDISVEKGVGAGCDKEAVRLIKGIHYTSVKNRGKRVKTTKKIRIEFKLPSRKSINFEVVSNKKVEPKKQTASKVYSYSIKLQ
ncbi:MAG: TonB family protein [Draconibacterium sp.]|nr:TonB family protein [Draconibacterium sp.]